MKAKIFSFALLVAVVLVFSLVSAQVPNQINYQGKLTTPAGGLMDTVVSMQFSIYADPTTTTYLWRETQGSVTVSKSVFNVILGSVTPIPASVFDGSTRYLGIKVGNDSEMSPRKPIVSVAYAYKAGTDGDWAFRITDTADTTLVTGGRWGIARYGNTLYGNGDSTHVNLGVASTTGASGQNYKYCTVGGGMSNTASGPVATVGGGYYNVASWGYATVAGGYDNTASGYYATVGGGFANTANNTGATVGGGEGDTASVLGATVGGGFHNVASGNVATVGGGSDNTASGIRATVGGGAGNTASGQYATIGGGGGNTVSGDYSFASGYAVNISSTADYTFAFGYNFTTSTPSAVIFYDASNPIKVGIQVTAPTHYIDVAGGAYCNGTNWVNASSIKYKKDIRSLTPQEYQEILAKLAQTEVVRYRYKSQDDDELHLGVIAEDAPEEMVDAERTGIPTGDAIGFLMAALKAQQEQIDALKAKLQKLESNR